MKQVFPGRTFLGKSVASAYRVSFLFIFFSHSSIGYSFPVYPEGTAILSVHRVPYGLGFICVCACVYKDTESAGLPATWSGGTVITC